MEPNTETASAEQADLDAGVQSIQDAQTPESNNEAYQDEGGQDLSDMLADDFGEDTSLETPALEPTVAPTAPQSSTDPLVELAAESTPVAEVSPSPQTPEPQTPSLETATREDLLARLLQANDDMATLRAEQAEAPAPAEGQETETPAKDPVEVRQAAESLLTEQYALTEEQADAYLTSPETVLPQYAANLHLSIMTTVAQMIRAHVPSMIHATLNQTTESESWDTSFYSKWKGLVDHKEDVIRMKNGLKQMYPSATEAELDQQTGAFLSIKHGVVPDQVAAVQNPPGRKPLAPHRPVARGPTTAAAPNAQGQNFFEDLAEDDMTEHF